MVVMRLRVFVLALLVAPAAGCTSATGCGNGQGSVRSEPLEDPSWRTTVPTTLDQFAGGDIVHASFRFTSSLTTADRDLVRGAGGTILIEMATEGAMIVQISAANLRSFVASYAGDRVRSVHVNILGADGGC
jgi:hypothetical protein